MSKPDRKPIALSSEAFWLMPDGSKQEVGKVTTLGISALEDSDGEVFTTEDILKNATTFTITWAWADLRKQLTRQWWKMAAIWERK